MANFIVVKSGVSFLGYSTVTDLGILHLDPMGTLGTGDCNTVDDTFVRTQRKIPHCVPGNWKAERLSVEVTR